MKSIWNVNVKEYPSLKENKYFDILIIGGGITGISICYYLKECKYKIGLIEQNKLFSSTTLNSSAKLTYLQKDILSKISKNRNIDIALEYLNSQIDAINNIKNIIKKEKIDCDLDKNDSFLFTLNKKNKNKISEEYKLYKKFNIDAVKIKKLPDNMKVSSGFKVPDTYVFHPLKYCNSLLKLVDKNISIYENTRFIKYIKYSNYYKVITNNNNYIKCKYLIFANSYPNFLFPYLFPIKTYIEKDNVICEKSKNLYFNAINIDDDLLSIRYYKNYIIKVINSNKLNVKSVNDNINKNYIYKFNNYDIITYDYMPFIGKIDRNIYIASGYNTWGMTNSNIAAKTISDLILFNDSIYKKLFDPYRKIKIINFLNLCSNMFQSLFSFLSSHLCKRDYTTIKYINGKKYGIYIDKNKKEHVVKLTCPHMKCGLHFNSIEKTWDCPCHGSKFSIDGNIIRGPSTQCIKKHK